MEQKFSNFMNQIPINNMQEDEKYLGNSIAIFRPKKYITRRLIQSEDFHLFVLSSPPPDIYINGKQQTIERRRIFVINPGDSVYCDNAPKTKPFTSILIKPNVIDKIAKEMGVTKDIRFLKLQNPFSRDIICMIESLCREIEHRDSFTLMLNCLETQIIILLLRQFKTNIKNDPKLLPDSATYINLGMEYMQTFYNSNITIEDICDEIHVSPFHFIRTFKQKTGLSPHQYLLSVRIQKAKELLQSGEYSVGEVAALCGFFSVPHFSNTFKSITGQSPSNYKRAAKETF